MKQVENRKWLYVMSGYAGSSSTYIAPYEKTGHKDGGYIFCFDTNAKTTPIVDEWRCISIDGRGFTTSDNEIGRPGIGGTVLKPDYCPTICHTDAKLLLTCGFTTEQVEKAFGGDAFLDYDEREQWEGTKEPSDLTDEMLEMLLALKAKKEEIEETKKREAAERFAKAREEAKKKFSFLPNHKGMDNTTGEVSQNLRAMLKRKFPNVRFSVRSSRFSGGDSCKVSYTNGPALAKVSEVVDMFQTHHQDFTGDYWDYDPSAFNKEFGGFSYTHTDRHITDEMRKKVFDILRQKHHTDSEDDLWRMVRGICNKADFPNGAEIKDVVFQPDEGHAWGEYKIVFDEPVKTENDNLADPIVGEESGITITENKEKNGVEIRFEAIPSEEVRNKLKANGFRWSRFSKCWYNRMTDENLAIAKEIAKAS